MGLDGATAHTIEGSWPKDGVGGIQGEDSVGEEGNR